MKNIFNLRNVATIIACLAITAIVCCKDDDNGKEKEKNALPVLTTIAASDVTQTTATIGGNITDVGKPAYTERGVCYATTQSPTTDNKIIIDGTGTGNFSIEVSGLTSNTTYYARAYAINSEGTAYGNEVSFTTQSPVPPVLTTSAVRNISSTTATLGGNITNVGDPAYTERGVCFATTQNPTTDNNKKPVAGTDADFSITVDDLASNTTYYVRAYAINTEGTAYGSEVTFKTLHQGEPEMVFVEGGTFTMGSPDGVGYSWERPQHQVTLSNFNIGKFEVTQSQWKAVMGNNPSNFNDKGDNFPIEQVSWDDIQEFLTQLNQLTGKNYRLPTEAEWEYAARGGKQTHNYNYSGSNTIDNVAWYRDNSGSSTHQVGTKQANELGIYDMSGNVWEWCSDWYGSYTSEAQTNPAGPATGSDRVIRGGSWGNDASDCRVAFRYSSSPGFRSLMLGFRVVLP
jgi:formylglycine-generating enzyme required for sulfatase activity